MARSDSVFSITSYQLIVNSTHEEDSQKFSGSGDSRKFLVFADDITAYELEKLKFLMFAVLPQQKNAVQSASNVTAIYELLKKNNVQQAMSVVCLLLEAVGVQCNVNFERKSPCLDFAEFEWRKKLLQYCDEARMEKKDSMLVNYLYKKYPKRIRLKKESITFAPLELFSHMIEVRIFTPGEKKDLRVVQKALERGKKIRLAQIVLGVGAVVSFIVATAMFAAISGYSRVRDINEPLKLINYTHNVTLLAVNNLDLRYYTGGSISVKIDKHDSYDVSVCSVSCDSSGLTKSMPIYSTRNKTYFNGSNPRFTASFPTSNSIAISNVQALKGSHFSIALESLDNTSPASNFKVYAFNNVSKCSDFVDGRLREASEEELTSPFVVSPTSDKDSGLVCVVVELFTFGNYSLTASGTVVQYETATALNNTNLCASYSSDKDITSETRKIIFKLPRPFPTTINPRPQKFCVLMTIEKDSPCKYSICTGVSVDATLFGTISNVGVILFSIVATLVLILSVIFAVSCLCCFALQLKF